MFRNELNCDHKIHTNTFSQFQVSSIGQNNSTRGAPSKNNKPVLLEISNSMKRCAFIFWLPQISSDWVPALVEILWRLSKKEN